MKWFSLVNLLFIFVCFNSVANDAQKLKVLLSRIDSVESNFSQQVVDQQEILYESTGRFYVQRPNKLRWETLDPDEGLMIADGTALWQYDYFVEQVTILSQTSAIANNPIILLASQDEGAWSKYQISVLENYPSLMTGVDEGYSVTPNDKEGLITELQLFFSDSKLSGLSTKDSQGQYSHLRLTDTLFNKRLEDELFAPSIPDNFVVDDQR